MNKLIAVAALSLCTVLPAHARCKHEAQPTVLDAIVVTPKGSYTLAEYEAKMTAKRNLEATKITLAPIVVTPNDPFADTETHQVAQQNHAQGAHASHASASIAPGAPKQPTLINYLRRLFF